MVGQLNVALGRCERRLHLQNKLDCLSQSYTARVLWEPYIYTYQSVADDSTEVVETFLSPAVDMLWINRGIVVHCVSNDNIHSPPKKSACVSYGIYIFRNVLCDTNGKVARGSKSCLPKDFNVKWISLVSLTIFDLQHLKYNSSYFSAICLPLFSFLQGEKRKQQEVEPLSSSLSLAPLVLWMAAHCPVRSVFPSPLDLVQSQQLNR